MNQFKREWRLALRRRMDWLTPLAFFLMVASVFPFGLSPEKSLLQALAPGVLWASLLLASLLSLDSLFRDELLNGCLEQVKISGQSMVLLVVIKILVHWLITGGVLTLVSPVIMILYNVDMHYTWIVMVSVLLGGLCLSSIGAIGAALLGAQAQNGMLMALLVLPLNLPVMIFGAGTLRAMQLNLPVEGYLALLAGGGLFSLVLGSLLAALAIQINLD